jgi:hypothetical protein
MFILVIPDLTVAELAEASGISACKGNDRERSEPCPSLFFDDPFIDEYLPVLFFRYATFNEVEELPCVIQVTLFSHFSE